MSKLSSAVYRIASQKLDGGERFRIAVISDYHDNSSEEESDQLLCMLRKDRPDLILCSGDLITAVNGFFSCSHALKLAGQLTRIAPVCSVNGNHETRSRNREKYGDNYNHYMKRLKETGVTVLNNAHKTLEIRERKVAVYGLELPISVYSRFHRMVVTRQDLVKRLGEPPSDFTILMAHHPDFVSAYADWGADLVLSGHLHGGMIRLPLLGGVAGASLLPFPRYDHGRFSYPGGEMIVSSGLGDHTIRIRFNNPHELVWLV